MFQPSVETMAAQERAALQQERLDALVTRLKSSDNPYWQQKLDGVAGSELQSLPFTVKAELRDHYPFGTLAVPLADTVRIHASSGTRGKPTIVAYTAADVRLLRERYPGVPVVTYVNTSAAVKAESDICCTSGNARKVIESLGVGRVIMLPDEYLAQNVAAETGVEIITWAGHCEVHERFTAAEIRELRAQHPGVIVLAHPECPPEVVAEADFAGSTAAMGSYVADRKPRRVVLVTECSMSDNVATGLPDVEFIRPCNLCPHMKRISLANILESLHTLEPRVEIDPAIAGRARLAVERMIAVGR